MCRSNSNPTSTSEQAATPAQEIKAPAEGPPSQLQKDRMRLSRKLREMAKIQELVESKGKVDPLQLQKLAKRQEVEGELAAVDNALAKEEALRAEIGAVQLEAASGPEAAGFWSGAPEMVALAFSDPRFAGADECKAVVPAQGGVCSADHPSGARAFSGPSGATGAPSGGRLVEHSVDEWFEHREAQAPDEMRLSAESDTRSQEVARRVHEAQLQAEARAAQRMAQNGSSRSWKSDQRHGQQIPSSARLTQACNFENFTDAMAAGGAQKEMAVSSLRGTVLSRSFDAAGCREVQAALQSLDGRTAGELLMELHGHVWDLIKSPHGNYVVQKVIEVMPPVQAAFIAAELRGSAANVAKHRYGCRILCRLLEHSTGDERSTDVIEELLAEAEELLRHPFAHHVMGSVLEHGQPEHRRGVCQALCWNAFAMATDRHASFVVEAALSNCDPEDQELLARALLEVGTETLVALARSRFGSHVARALLRSSSAAGCSDQAKLLGEILKGRRQQDSYVKGRKRVRHAAAAA